MFLLVAAASELVAEARAMEEAGREGGVPQVGGNLFNDPDSEETRACHAVNACAAVGMPRRGVWCCRPILGDGFADVSITSMQLRAWQCVI